MVRREKWRFHEFTLKAGQTAFKNGACLIKQSDAKAYAGQVASGMIAIGLFAEDQYDAAADTLVNVDLLEEKTLVWFRNATDSDAVAATDFGKDVYFFDDHSVTITSTGASKAGRVWAVDSVKGVLVEVGRNA